MRNEDLLEPSSVVRTLRLVRDDQCRWSSASVLSFPAQCLSIHLRDSLRGEAWIDHRRDIFIRLIRAPLRALHYPVAVRHQQAEFNLRSPTKALLTRAILHLERKAKLVQPRVHSLVQNRRCHFGVGEPRVDRERQLDQAGSLLVKVRSSTCKAFDYDVGEVSLDVPEVVGHDPFDELQRPIESCQHVSGIYVWP